MKPKIHISYVIWGAACIFFAGVTPSSANGNLDIYSTLDVCAEKSDNINDVVNKLTLNGWQAVPSNKVSDKTVTDLSWIYMGLHLSGNPTHTQISNQADLQKRTVQGISRKKDIPSIKTRFLVKDVQKTSEAMIVTWVQLYPHMAWVECSLALKASTPIEWSNEVAAYMQISPSELPIIFASSSNTNEGDVKTQMSFYLINTQKLKDNSVPNATVSSAVKMHSTFPYTEVTP